LSQAAEPRETAPLTPLRAGHLDQGIVGPMKSLPPEGLEEAPSLSDRMPDYAVTFVVGLAAAVAVGAVISLVSDNSLSTAVGYTLILYGVVLLLAGGSSGGGYTNLGMGAMGSMFGTRRVDDVEPDMGSPQNPTARERLDQGLRPEANPRAFWQVVGGGLYIALGLLVLIGMT